MQCRACSFFFYSVSTLASQLIAETPDSRLRRATISSKAVCAGVCAMTSASTRTRSLFSMSTLSRLRKINGPALIICTSKARTRSSLVWLAYEAQRVAQFQLVCACTHSVNPMRERTQHYIAEDNQQRGNARN
jgi:hypothetical protein